MLVLFGAFDFGYKVFGCHELLFPCFDCVFDCDLLSLCFLLVCISFRLLVFVLVVVLMCCCYLLCFALFSFVCFDLILLGFF